MAVSMERHMIGDPVLTKRLGLGVSRRAGLVCLSSTKLPGPLFNHVTGYGTFAEASPRTVDAVIRHYERVGVPARIEVMHPAVRAGDVRLLEKRGFRLVRVAFHVNARTTSSPPRSRAVPGLRIERVRRADAARYAKLATRGFGGGRSVIAQVFEHGWIRQLRSGTRAVAFIGSVDGAPAATGVLLRGTAVAGLYSGSVLPRFRGRGIQNAMIAARLAEGWGRGHRIFYAMSDLENEASTQNLHDEGFRRRFELHVYDREPG
jgi:ribosomal protein S18 acetylase RimI-like enzyme